jgi:ParB/RepB/Spo0J family partition protein
VSTKVRSLKRTEAPAKKVTLPGERGKRIVKQPAPREQLAADERVAPRSEPTINRCSDCGELIEQPRMDLTNTTLCARCDAEVALAGTKPSARAIERYPIELPAESRCSAEIQVGEVAAGRWAWGYKFSIDAEGDRPRCETVEPCRVLDDADSRELAQTRAARALAMRAAAQWWPPDARGKLASYAAALENGRGAEAIAMEVAGTTALPPDDPAWKNERTPPAPGKDDSAFGVTVPRMLEPHRVPFPAETRCQAWVQAGQLDSGRWLATLEAENLATGKRLLAGAIHESWRDLVAGSEEWRAVAGFATRDEAFDFAAAQLYELASADRWPAAAMAAIACFRADKPWVARQQRHEALVAAKARNKPDAKKPEANGRAPREASPLSTVTPAGIAANDPDVAKPKNRGERKERGETDTKTSAGSASSAVSPSVTVELGRLGRNRFNPRESFQEADIEELAEELKRDGQIQPIVIRRAAPGGKPLKPLVKGGTPEYEIVAGERRALAAVKAGWSQLRAEVIEADDARACRLAIAENKHRKDISQVEYARGLQKLADLTGLDPAGLAKDQGLSDQHVRNLLRLLKTPPEWQQLVIDGKIDGTHLRAAAPYLHVPAIAKKLAKAAGSKEKLSTAEWQQKVRSAVWQHGEKLDRHSWTDNGHSYKSTNLSIKPTHPQWAELDVVEINGQHVALNGSLAKKLLDETEKDWKKKNSKQSDRKDAKAAKEKAELTPAERKKHAAEQQRKFQGRLDNWFYDWLRVLCAAALKPGGVCHNCEQGAQWLIAYALWARPGNHYSELDTAEELAGHRTSKYHSDALDFLQPRDGNEAAELMHMYAPRLLVEADGSPRGPTSGGNAVIFDRVVTVLARDVLGLDLPAAWKADRRSPMREKYWNLHSMDQLAELGEELGVFVAPNLKKSEAVSVLLAVERALPVPKELGKLVAQLQPSKSKAKIAKRKPR